jgi:hypothetical protein
MLNACDPNSRQPRLLATSRPNVFARPGEKTDGAIVMFLIPTELKEVQKAARHRDPSTTEYMVRVQPREGS